MKKGSVTKGDKFKGLLKRRTWIKDDHLKANKISLKYQFKISCRSFENLISNEISFLLQN